MPLTEFVNGQEKVLWSTESFHNAARAAPPGLVARLRAWWRRGIRTQRAQARTRPLLTLSYVQRVAGFAAVAAPCAAARRVATLRIGTATMGESKLLRELDAELSTIAQRNVEIPAELAKLQEELATLNAREQEIAALLSFLQGRNSVGAAGATDLDELITAGSFCLQRGGPVQVLEDLIAKLKTESATAGRIEEVVTIVRQLEAKAQTKRDWPMADRYRTNTGTLDAKLATAVKTMAARGVDAPTISKMLNVPEPQVRLYV